MFRYIKAKNFLSFKDVEFNFIGTKDTAKDNIFIYGENGSGKSNFVNSIVFLRKTIDSFLNPFTKERIDDLLKTGLPQDIITQLSAEMDILEQAKRCKMLDSNETSIEYGFSIGDHKGYYKLSFDTHFTEEELYYFTGKQSGKLFSIQNVDDEIKIYFSKKLFLTDSIKAELTNEIDKYWGKHTFLSILTKERRNKNEGYINNNILSYVYDFIFMLSGLMVHCKDSGHSIKEFNNDSKVNLLPNLEQGQIHRGQELILQRSEVILKDFFTQTYADIKDAYYAKEIIDNKIEYKLFFKKMIGGSIKDIDVTMESAGTRNILNIFKTLLGAFLGLIVVYDEIDDGIHDLLLKAIITSMKEHIDGQFIVTTHNTLLMETIEKQNLYIINVDYKGNKEVICLDEYPIQKNHNRRSMYLKGLFGGVPIVENIDYDEIINRLLPSSRRNQHG